jgi:hypothetical protein
MIFSWPQAGKTATAKSKVAVNRKLFEDKIDDIIVSFLFGLTFRVSRASFASDGLKPVVMQRSMAKYG